MKILGVLGYLLIVVGTFLMSVSPFFGILSVIGFVMVALAWLWLGQKSGESVMFGNGIFMLLILVLSFLIPLLVVILGNFRLLGYGVEFLLTLTFISLVFDLGSHARAYIRFKIRSFAIAFILRLFGVVFSAYVVYEMRDITEVSDIYQLMNFVKAHSPQLAVFSLVIVLANVLSATGFYELKDEKRAEEKKIIEPKSKDKNKTHQN